MLFNSLGFLIFFLAFLFIYNFFNTKKSRSLFFLITSLLYYASWDYRYIVLPTLLSAVDFFLAKKIESKKNKSVKNLLLFVSIFLNVGLLVYFKYFNFFIQSGVGLIHLFGGNLNTFSEMSILLPVGISFYTFQSMSYVLDVYRQETKACAHLIDFMSAVCFFPHLLAGPIVRPSQLIPQFESPTLLITESIRLQAVLLIVVGLIKKGVADTLSVYTNKLFSSNETIGLLDSWVGALAFHGQIYGDFSGYTDMAIGLSLFVGIVLPKNFYFPFTAINPTEYWNRRWHLTLSKWFHDYLYIPLATWSMRLGLRSPYFAVFISMTLIGLWHGADLTFLIYGFYHGVLIILTHILGKSFRSIYSPNGIQKIAQIIFTFYLMVIGHVIFRAIDLKQAFKIISSLHIVKYQKELNSLFTTTSLIVVIIFILLLHFISHLSEDDSLLLKKPNLGWLCAGILGALALMFLGHGQSFIYFQF